MRNLDGLALLEGEVQGDHRLLGLLLQLGLHPDALEEAGRGQSVSPLIRITLKWSWSVVLTSKESARSEKPRPRCAAFPPSVTLITKYLSNLCKQG